MVNNLFSSVFLQNCFQRLRRDVNHFYMKSEGLVIYDWNWDGEFSSFNWKMSISSSLTAVFILLLACSFSSKLQALDFQSFWKLPFAYCWKIQSSKIVSVDFKDNWRFDCEFFEVLQRFKEGRIWQSSLDFRGGNLWIRSGWWSDGGFFGGIFYDETKYFFSFILFLFYFIRLFEW